MILNDINWQLRKKRRRKYFYTVLVVALCAFAVSKKSQAQEATFEGIGFIENGTSSNAWAVSDIGPIVVGQGFSPKIGGAIRWENGVASLIENGSIAWGVSSDGTAIVGYGYFGNGDEEAFRWQNGIMTPLGDLPGGDFESWAWDVSADGSVVVGQSEDADGLQPFRWENGVMEALPHLPGADWGTAYGVSADGRYIAGASGGPTRWVDGVPESLGSPSFQPYDISADGRAITGHGYIWREREGTSAIPELTNPDSFVQAHAISGNGQVVAGVTLFGPFVWTEATGTRLIKDILETDYGLDLTGWLLSSVWYNGVNFDGTVIVGEAQNPNGDYEGWIATFPPWPVANEPESPESFTLTTSVYPNPIRDRATIRVVLDRPLEGRVIATDVLGRVVAVIHEGTLAAGGHSLSFDATGLPSGVYILQSDFGAAGSSSQTVSVVR